MEGEEILRLSPMRRVCVFFGMLCVVCGCWNWRISGLVKGNFIEGCRGDPFAVWSDDVRRSYIIEKIGFVIRGEQDWQDL